MEGGRGGGIPENGAGAGVWDVWDDIPNPFPPYRYYRFNGNSYSPTYGGWCTAAAGAGRSQSVLMNGPLTCE